MTPSEIEAACKEMLIVRDKTARGLAHWIELRELCTEYLPCVGKAHLELLAAVRELLRADDVGDILDLEAAKEKVCALAGIAEGTGDEE